MHAVAGRLRPSSLSAIFVNHPEPPQQYDDGSGGEAGAAGLLLAACCLLLATACCFVFSKGRIHLLS